MQIPDGIEGTLCWNANTAYKHGHKKQCKIKEFIYLLKKAISKYLYEKWPCMALIEEAATCSAQDLRENILPEMQAIGKKINFFLTGDKFRTFLDMPSFAPS